MELQSLLLMDGVLPDPTLAEVTEVFASNVAFHRLSGDFPDPEQVRPDQVAAVLGAESQTPSSEILLLRDRTDALAGVVFLLHEHPDPADTFPWIGLLMTHRELHGLGYGRRAVELVEARLRAAGRGGVRLAVLENNTAALGFWTALGYREIDRRKDRELGRACFVLQKVFPGGEE
ncbi:hypothetical protein GCM10009760_46510 [Kitasatospora kazusensis]|uniref:N-acetyltransferase domain-containing protein n=1 Tax=Kitasatospora kazusensis TaxID=407974 RepID=A0ABP5LPV2_9ACTN